MTAHKKQYVSMQEKRLVKFMVENKTLSVESKGIKAEILCYLQIDILKVRITENEVDRIIAVKIANQK